MDNDDDFTFCQVGGLVDQSGSGTNGLASDIGSMTIKDGYSNVRNTHQNSGILFDGLANNGTTKEQTAGSLSFTITDKSSSKQSNELSRNMASTDSGTSVKNSQGLKVSTRKTAPRAKVPFEKGYSQMDWLRLTQTHPDLAGLKGQSNRRNISMSEVKEHTEEGSMWTVLKGRVYNLSPYMKFHPGGADMLMKAVGRDCTSLFNKYHAWVNAEFLLEKCLVGILEDSHK
ncbi:hypothetical protein K2173_011394 [Erythroxylum novogranatense]|uniref:Cytochrome b5 heme-binding domain-containing protein n=1 Tax=Erythroxylum novogranatense TaxID=1862640 RepID=A0AAV8S9S6_9ROSI|nr:hypothetical protein K2173_011394 [Erythroxylum novogranatense]